MASSAKDIQFKELKDTISQLNTTICTQNDLIMSLQRMLEERNAKDERLPALILGGHASSSLVSHIMYEKYADALPLYRQEKVFELLGISISRTTMADWIITCAPDYLQPVYDYFHRLLLGYICTINGLALGNSTSPVCLGRLSKGFWITLKYNVSVVQPSPCEYPVICKV